MAGNQAALVLINCTVTANSATSGGGVYDVTNAPTLINTIVAGQTAGGDLAGLSPGGNNNLIGGDAKLSPLGDYGGPTLSVIPLPGSPAIGGGAAGPGVPATDQRGFARSGHVDIGATQDQGVTLVVNATTDGVGVGPASSACARRSGWPTPCSRPGRSASTPPRSPRRRRSRWPTAR